MSTDYLIGGLPVFVYGGMFVGLLLVVQVLGGLKIINIPLVWHKRMAYIILALTAIHGIVGVMYFLGK